MPKIVKENVAKFEGSFENKLRSVGVLYSNGLLRKKKYRSVGLNMSTCFNGTSNKWSSLKFVHPKLMKFVDSINTGNVKDFSDFCNDLDDDNQVSGSYRDSKSAHCKLSKLLKNIYLRVATVHQLQFQLQLQLFISCNLHACNSTLLEEMFLELGDMYVSLYKKNPFLLNFGEPFWPFRVALGADRAPFGKDDEATAWLLSFLNVGGRIGSCNENFLLCSVNCSESHPSMFKFAQKLVLDVAYIEKQIYVLPGSKTKARFKVELIPSDMKWAATFSGELSNAAHFFSPFGNVSESNKCTVNGCLGPAETYQDRLEVTAKVTAKKEELEKTALAESTKRSKVLNYIQSLNSRQEYVPVLKKLVDKMYVEPLHNANNGWLQLHVLILSHANDKSGIPSTCTDFSKMTDCPLASHLLTLKQIGASRLFKKVKKWFWQGRKGTLSYRFTGKETRIMCQDFMKLVEAVSSEQDTPIQSLQITHLHLSVCSLGLQPVDLVE